MIGDTLFALASGGCAAAVAVVRIGGPASGRVLERLSGRALPVARRASLRDLRHPVDGELLDRALVLWLPGPGSYTGEDMVELHLHGGQAVVRGVLEALAGMEGMRPAEPGEFTRRAFLAGKLDLSEAEAVADLVNAQTAAQRRQALAQARGALGQAVAGWCERVEAVLAHAEALIDFADEDLPEDLQEAVRAEVAALHDEMMRQVRAAPRAAREREGWRVAVLGVPNVGKSSLLNALAGRDAAIVAPEAGTTRDVVEVWLELDGRAVAVADTAGLRDAEGAVEQEGVRRAAAAADGADLLVLVEDATAFPHREEALDPWRGRLHVEFWNKADLRAVPGQGLSGSALTGMGIGALLSAIAGALPATDAGVLVNRPRHLAAMREAAEALGRATEAPLAELAAEDLRLAWRALGRLVGANDVEDLLDRIFSEFCIGK